MNTESCIKRQTLSGAHFEKVRHFRSSSHLGVVHLWLSGVLNLVVTFLLTGSGNTFAGEIVAWGANEDLAHVYTGQATPPQGLTNVVAISAGGQHSLALDGQGKVTAWGRYYSDNNYVVPAVPASLSNVVAVSAGGDHSLALTAEGRVIGWGMNSFGQTNVPVGLSNVMAISAGYDHNLALTREGRVVAWGNNYDGETTVPAGLSNVVAIAAGGFHSLALTADGRVVGWGANDDADGNYAGQATIPAGLSNVIAITAGEEHSSVLTAEGGVVSWGRYYTWSGVFVVSRPMTVPEGLSNVVAISALGGHNLALTLGGRVVAWGSDISDEIDVPSGLSNVVMVAAGGAHSLALVGMSPGTVAPQIVSATRSVGTVDMPFYYRIVAKNGATSFGSANLPPGLSLDSITGLITGSPTQPGVFTFTLRATNSVGIGSLLVTVFVNLPVPSIANSDLLVLTLGLPWQLPVIAYNSPSWYGATGLPPGLTIDSQSGLISGTPVLEGDFPVSLTATNRHGIGSGMIVVRVSTVVGWGSYDIGNSYIPTTVPAGLSNVVALAAGNSYSLALTSAGRVYAWGKNSGGLLVVPAELTNIVAIAGGGEDSLAVTRDGRVISWTSFWDGSYQRRTIPAGLSNVVAIAGGDVHSLALTAEGRVVAWGDNEFGRTNVPASLSQVVAIAAGGGHNLALTAEGRLVAWGSVTTRYSRYWSGQATIPEGLSNVVAIAAGGDNCLALTSDGRVVDWGAEYTNLVSGLSNVSTLAAGFYHSVALATDGKVAAWGNDDWRQTDVPDVLSNVAAIAAGDLHSLALVGMSPGTVAPQIVSASRLVGTVDMPFYYRIVPKNGATSFGSGNLPPGLSLDSITGLITGSPTQPGVFTFTLRANNNVGVGSLLVTLFVNLPVPTIANSGLTVLTLGLPSSLPIVAYNYPTWYGATGLPPGVNIDSQSGLISGTPVLEGDFPVSLTATNRHGMATNSITLRVSAVVGWGRHERSGPAVVPTVPTSNVVAVAAGGTFSLALSAEGKVTSWGSYYSGITLSMTTPAGLSNVIAIAAGGDHALGLKANGVAVGWGNNQYGQATVSPAFTNLVAVAAGDLHSLALNADGRVVAWGYNNYGQTNTPAGLSNAIAIAAGARHSLALMSNGRVVGWGDNRDFFGNYVGQATAPQGLSNLIAIAAGDSHSLALTTSGRVVAWGRNNYGQTNVPPGLSNVVAIAAGEDHSAALTTDGKVLCWGRNFVDQTNVPVGLSNSVAIAAGGSHSLALVGLSPGLESPQIMSPSRWVGTVQRPLYFRILAKNGVTGYGATGLPRGLTLAPTTGLITGSPVQPGEFSFTLWVTNGQGVASETVTLFINLPVPSITNSGFAVSTLSLPFESQLVAYNEPLWFGAVGLPSGLSIDPHTGLISGVPDIEGSYPITLLASNQYGMGTATVIIAVNPLLGWGKYYNGSTLVPITVPTGIGNVVSIAAGGSHSLALLGDGRVVAWGRNNYGQTNVPVTLTNAVAIAAGYNHSLALTDNGLVVAWGNNTYGQAAISGSLTNTVAIAAGDDHSLAVTGDGRVIAWGRNSVGQTNVPPSLTNAVGIAAGSSHCVALTSQGRVVTWGFSLATNAPSTLTNAVAVAAGGSHSLALTTQKRVVAWGYDSYGATNVPTGLSNITAIAAGDSHNLALTDEGRVVVWGNNANDQTNMPTALNDVVAISARGYYSLALIHSTITSPRPYILVNDGYFGIRSSGFGFNISAKPGQVVVIEASTNLSVWIPVQTNTLDSTPFYFSDSGSTNCSKRFYRVRMQ